MSKKSKHLSKFKPASENFEFSQFPFYWIMRVGNSYSHKMEKILKKVGMNITTWRTGLILKEKGAMSITEIATHAVYRLPTITKTVYKMQEKGLVTIKSREDDGRVSIVTVTEKGLENIEYVINNTTKIFNNSFDGLTEAQMNKLNASLEQIFLNLSDD